MGMVDFEQMYKQLKSSIRIKNLYDEYIAEKRRLETPLSYDLVAPDLFRVDIKSLISNKTVQAQLRAAKSKEV